MNSRTQMAIAIGLSMVISLSGASAGNVVITTIQEQCEDNQAGVGRESYDCPIQCEEGDDVLGSISADRQVPVIFVEAKCGEFADADYCWDARACAVDGSTDIAAAGSCEGYSRSGNFARHQGSLDCMAGTDLPGGSGTGFASSGSTIVQELRALIDDTLSCEKVAEEVGDRAFELTSGVLIWYEISEEHPEGHGVGVQILGNIESCISYQPKIIVSDGGVLIS